MNKTDDFYQVERSSEDFKPGKNADDQQKFKVSSQQINLSDKEM